MSEETTVKEKAILIRITQLYRESMSPRELYEATRGVWKVGPRRNKADLAFAVAAGLIQEIYEIEAWLPAGTLPYETRPREDLVVAGRWEFKGKLANDALRSRYLGKSVKHYLPRGAANPVTYVNC